MPMYIIDGRKVIKDATMFYFAWTVNGGHVTFGYHGTEKEWEARCLLEKKEIEESGREPRTIKIIEKQEIPDQS